MLLEQFPSIEAVSSKLGPGERTLQRQLKQQDVLFSEITEGILKQGALQPLQATNAPILQIAFTL